VNERKVRQAQPHCQPPTPNLPENRDAQTPKNRQTRAALLRVNLPTEHACKSGRREVVKDGQMMAQIV